VVVPVPGVTACALQAMKKLKEREEYHD